MVGVLCVGAVGLCRHLRHRPGPPTRWSGPLAGVCPCRCHGGSPSLDCFGYGNATVHHDLVRDAVSGIPGRVPWCVWRGCSHIDRHVHPRGTWCASSSCCAQAAALTCAAHVGRWLNRSPVHIATRTRRMASPGLDSIFRCTRDESGTTGKTVSALSARRPCLRACHGLLLPSLGAQAWLGFMAALPRTDVSVTSVSQWPGLQG